MNKPGPRPDADPNACPRCGNAQVSQGSGRPEGRPPFAGQNDRAIRTNDPRKKTK